MSLGEEARLIKDAKGGDARAKEILLERNEGLIRHLSARFRLYGREEDLYQTACLGFLKAVESYDPEYGVKLSTYAVSVIVGELKKYLRDQSPLRLSRGDRQRMSKLKETREALLSELGREPSVGEIARRLGWEPGDAVHLLESMRVPVSLEEVKPVEKGSDWVESSELRQLVGELPERERVVISGRFYQDLTQEELSRKLGLSQSQVSRLEKSALMRLRTWYLLDSLHQKE